MQPNTLVITYLAAVLLQTLCEAFLIRLNISAVRENAGNVPAVFQSVISADQYERSTAYSLEKARFSLASLAWSFLVRVAIVLSGILGTLDAWVGFSSTPRLHGIAFVLISAFLLSLVDLPFSLYSTFVIEQKYGFNRTTFRTWCLDVLRSAILSVVLLTPLLAGLFWFVAHAGSLWWLYAFAFIAAFQLALVYLFPTFVAPLFNKFSPLPEGALRDGIEKLAQALNFKTTGIYVMDGSRRSAHANAYFTGLAGKKRIVLFDTLIKLLTPEQVVAVLAHEIGHEKKGHIKRSLLLSMVVLFFGMWILSAFIDYEPVFRAFGFERPSIHGGVVLLQLVASPLLYFIGPLVSALSRLHEYQADRYAIDAVGGWNDLASALTALSKESLSNLTPHPLYSFFHYSHPTLIERIAAMRGADNAG